MRKTVPPRRVSPSTPPPVRVRRNVRTMPAKPKKQPTSSDRDWGYIRILGVGICFTLVLCALWGRAFSLQILRGPELAEMARRQHITTEQISGVRGNIIDRNGNILARSIDISSVWVDPAVIEDKGKTATVLAKILKMPRTRVMAAISEKKRFVWLARKVEYSVAEQIRKADLRGVKIENEYARTYPYKGLAGQLLGFVDIDDKGLEGIEKAFDARLSGERKKQSVQRDASGRRLVIQGKGIPDDLHGQDVQLTLDMNVQFFAEESLAEYVEKYGALWGGCIIVDVPTGEVLAWAQFPLFDPNNYKQFKPEERRNRLAMDALEQGSTIKSFLIAAALEEKVITAETPINCEKGRWKLGSSYIHDTHPYDVLPAKKILHVSSNIASAKIGKMLGATKYHNYLTRVGFGERTGLPLPGEARGIMRPANRWKEIDLATASFGQSFSATLVQMAQAYLVLASDGEKKPLKLALNEAELPGAMAEASRTAAAPDKIFSSATVRELRSMLREVVEEGRGTGRNARISGMEVGGKTGTAQKAKNGRYGQGRVGSFVGMVPIENPRYLILVLLDEPTKVQYGGIIAAPVFRDVALSTMAYYGLLPDSDDPLVKEIAEKEKQKNKKKGVATATPVSTAATSAADANDHLAASAPLAVYEKDTVPSVTGLTLQRAIESFNQHGVVPSIVGSGSVVISQSPAPGSAWAGTKECIIWLKEQAI